MLLGYIYFNQYYRFSQKKFKIDIILPRDFLRQEGIYLASLLVTRQSLLYGLNLTWGLSINTNEFNNLSLTDDYKNRFVYIDSSSIEEAFAVIAKELQVLRFIRSRYLGVSEQINMEFLHTIFTDDNENYCGEIFYLPLPVVPKKPKIDIDNLWPKELSKYAKFDRRKRRSGDWIEFTE